jgi:hypothetical protein
MASLSEAQGDVQQPTRARRRVGVLSGVVVARFERHDQGPHAGGACFGVVGCLLLGFVLDEFGGEL